MAGAVAVRQDAPLRASGISPVTAEGFREGMRRLVAGVTIVTTGTGDARRGMAVTAVCSLTVDPPSLLVCINRTAEAHDIIAHTGRLCVNVLSSEDARLSDRFAARDGVRGLPRFDEGDWQHSDQAPPRLGSALATFDCTVDQATAYGSHTVFFCRVTGLRVAEGAVPPLLYVDRSYGVPAPMS